MSLQVAQETREWGLYRVEVEQTRSGEAFIWAPSKEQAEEDAANLTLDILDGEYPETDTFVLPEPVEGPLKKTWVWTGGLDGEWVAAEEWVRPDSEKLEEAERLRPWKGQRDIFGGEVGSPHNPDASGGEK